MNRDDLDDLFLLLVPLACWLGLCAWVVLTDGGNR